MKKNGKTLARVESIYSPDEPDLKYAAQSWHNQLFGENSKNLPTITDVTYLEKRTLSGPNDYAIPL